MISLNKARLQARRILDRQSRYKEAVTETMAWQQSLIGRELSSSYDFDGSTFFYETPPVTITRPSDRIMICGTNVALQQLTQFKEAKKELLKYSQKILSDEADTETIAKMSNLLKLIMNHRERIILAKDIGSFWQNFFDNESFLDGSEGKTIPAKMISLNGLMRDYLNGCGRYVDTRKRLADIAQTFKMPLEIYELKKV